MSVYGGPGGYPPPGQGYGQGYGQGQGYSMPPSVRFEAIGEAWNIVKENLGTWAVVTLIYAVISIVISVAIQFALSGAGLLPPIDSQNSDFSAAYVIGYIINFVVTMALNAFFTGGLLRMAARAARGESVTIGDLFSASDVLLQMFLVSLLSALAVYLGLFLCLIPGILIGIRLYFAPFLVADQRMGAIDAMKRSWAAIQGHGLNLFLFGLVAGLVYCAGALACGVGALITAPIAIVAVAIVYRDLLGLSVPITGPTLDMPLPPPSAYQPGQYPPPPPQQ